MTFKQRSGNYSFGSQHPTTPFIVEQIKDENVLNLVQHLGRKVKNLDIIHKIAYILEESLDLSYFRLLKSKLTEIDYLTVVQKLNVSFKQADSIIIEKKKRNDYFYVVLWGQIQVLDYDDTNQNNDGEIKKFQLINKLTKGNTFGQTSLINFKRQTTARVQAKTNSLLLTLSFDIFNKTILKITIMKKQQIANILTKSSLFLGIDQDSIKDLVSEVYEVRFGLNQIIYNLEFKHDTFYFVKNGIVQILQNGVKLVTMSLGEYFGIENKELLEEKRGQQAVSKSTDLVLYKIPFARLKIFQQTCLEKLMKNIRRDLNSKKQAYQKLLNNHKKVERIIANNTINNIPSSRKRNTKKENIPLNPVWWGTATRHSDSLPKLLMPLEEQKQKEKQPLRKSGLLGQKRINLLKYSVVPKQSENQNSQLNHSSSLIGSLPTTFFKKVVHQNIRSFDAQILKKRLVPQYQKQKLLKYAKSGVDSCETMFWM